MGISKEDPGSIVCAILVLIGFVLVGTVAARHFLGYCSCNGPKEEVKVASFAESIENDRPHFLPLSSTELQRVEDKKAEKRKKDVEKKRLAHKDKYGTYNCEVCCSDHMECKYCNVKMTLTAQQKRELDDRERVYKERNRRYGRRR